MYAATLKRLETGRPGRSWGAAEHPFGDRRDEKTDEELEGGEQEGRKWLEYKKIKSNFKKGKENKK